LAVRRERVDYRYWHSAIDGHTRPAFTDFLADERAITAAGLLRRAATISSAHGMTVERVLTDHGSCYRSQLFDAALPDGARHAFTRPHHGLPGAGPRPARRRRRHGGLLGLRGGCRPRPRPPGLRALQW